MENDFFESEQKKTLIVGGAGYVGLHLSNRKGGISVAPDPYVKYMWRTWDEKEFTIHSKSIELERIFDIFNFPHEVECVLSEAMLPRFQIHFLSPKSTGDKAHANFVFSSGGLVSSPSGNNHLTELNLMETAIPLSASKAEVSLPWM